MIYTIKKFISSQLIPPTLTTPVSQDLEGVVVVVTGASRGVGRATAEALYNDHASLVVVSRNKQDLENAFKNFDTKRIILLEADATKESDVKEIFDQTIAKFGRIDVLINNIGAFLQKPLDEVTTSDFDAIINTNMKSMFLMTRAVLPLMKKKKQGTIINIGSKISHNTNVEKNKTLYAMTKYAVEGFSFALNKELKSFGIRVVCLMPGTIGSVISRQSKNFLSPSHVATVIAMIVKLKDIDFEGIIFKSKHQNI